VVAPPRMALADAAGRGLPTRADMLTIRAEGAGVVLSALKKTEDRESITVRVFNPSTGAARLALHVAGGVREASELNLLEEAQQPLGLSNGAALLDVSASSLRTVELVPAQAPPRRAPR